MIIIVNYSHPLTEGVLAEISRIEQEEVSQVVVPCQLDMTPGEDLLEQVRQLEGHWHATQYYQPNATLYLVPPAMSYAAAILTAHLSYAISDAMTPIPPTIVWTTKVGMPPRFMLGGIIKC